MSYSFLLISGKANTIPVPVGASNNGQTAVLHRKSSSLNSTGFVSNGKATFDIPNERVTEFAGSYSVTVSGAVVQSGDIDIIGTASTGGGGGSGTVDLTPYATKSLVNSTVASAVSAKADKTYVDTVLSTKAALADLENKVDAAVIKPVAYSGNFGDLTGRPDLSGFITATTLTTGLNTKANLTDVYDKSTTDSKLATYATINSMNLALSNKVNTSTYATDLAAKANVTAVYEKETVDSLVAARAAATDVYSKAQIDSLLASAGSGGGGTITLLQKANGYCPPSSTTPVTSPAAGYSYVFQGIATPPFNREQDLWIVVDRGITSTPVVISLISSDDFDAGKNLATPAATALDTTKWGGENTFFRQSSTGEFVPVGWTATSKTYFVGDKTAAATAKMRVEFRHTGYASTATQRTLRLWINVTDPNVAYENAVGYGVAMDTTSSGTTENWAISRLENGVNVGTLGTVTQTRAAAPRNVVVDSDGKGAIKVTVDGVVLNGGNAFVDPSATPLSGKYAGISGYNQTNQAAASMNVKGDLWRVYG
jgi:hypothetical protein